MAERDYYTVSEVAKMLNVGISTIHRYISRKDLRAYHFFKNSRWRIPKKEFEVFLSKIKEATK